MCKEKLLKANYYTVTKDRFNNPRLEVLQTVEYIYDEPVFTATEAVRQIIDLQKAFVEYYFLVVYKYEVIRGIFLLAKGDAHSTPTDERQLLLDILLCDGNEFILIHNHPGNTDYFSNADLSIIARHNSLNLSFFSIYDIKYLDDILITDNDWIISAKQGKLELYSDMELNI